MAALTHGNRFILGSLSRFPSSLLQVTILVKLYDTMAEKMLNHTLDWQFISQQLGRVKSLQNATFLFMLPYETTKADIQNLRTYVSDNTSAWNNDHGISVEVIENPDGSYPNRVVRSFICFAGILY